MQLKKKISGVLQKQMNAVERKNIWSNPDIKKNIIEEKNIWCTPDHESGVDIFMWTCDIVHVNTFVSKLIHRTLKINSSCFEKPKLHLKI